MPEIPFVTRPETATEAIRRAITERCARITMSPAVRIHINTDDGYEGHYTVHEESDHEPCPNYVLDRRLNEAPFTPELSDAVYAAFSTQIDAAVECNATESDRLGNLALDLADEDEEPPLPLT